MFLGKYTKASKQVSKQTNKRTDRQKTLENELNQTDIQYKNSTREGSETEQ